MAKTTVIKNQHYPVHIDFSLPEEVRRASDYQWFTKILACFVEERFPRTLLKDMLEKSECRFRAGVVDFLKLAHAHNIPVLIFSGGLHDIIQVMLETEKCDFPNVQILANRFKYDSEGLMVGAEEPFITASSKLAVARESPYFTEVQRDHVLLLGDMLSDLKMAACAQHSAMLSVGYANTEKDVEPYQDHFDVVLPGNPGFEVVNEVLREIVEG